MTINILQSLTEQTSKIGVRGRNVGWNLLGQLLPMLAGIVVVPHLIQQIGTERFGFLSLVWVMMGYFSLFDLGLSRALTQRVAALRAEGNAAALSTATTTGLALIILLSLIVIPVLLASKSFLLGSIVNTSVRLSAEADQAYIWLVIGVPIVILAAGVRGVLEGHGKFARVNAVRTPAGCAMFILPWIFSTYLPSLQAVTMAVFIVRVIQLLGLGLMARRLLYVPNSMDVDRVEVRLLFSFGIWMSVSNVVGPSLVYLDRFAISKMGTLSDVTYYSTPFDLVTRLLFIGTAISSVMFPAFSGAIAASAGLIGGRAVTRLERQNYFALLSLIVPVTIVVIIFAGPGLRIWLGPVFETRSTLVLRLLSIGVLINVLGTVPYSMLQAKRRADLTAKTHLIELPLYVLLLIILVRSLGIDGAALAWVIRVAFDLGVMLWLVARERRLENLSMKPSSKA